MSKGGQAWTIRQRKIVKRDKEREREGNSIVEGLFNSEVLNNIVKYLRYSSLNKMKVVCFILYEIAIIF